MSIFALRSNELASSTYKNLSRAQASLNDNISRLASGLRITKTADDSVGSNVSVRMGNQISGMAQANRNTREANNLLASAESGLSDISGILGKMRELSVQASTDTLNGVDRASIDLEFQALKGELTRIANVTEYNGMNVLNGTYQTAGSSLQIHSGMEGVQFLSTDSTSPIQTFNVNVQSSSSTWDGSNVDADYKVEVQTQYGSSSNTFHSEDQAPFEIELHPEWPNAVRFRLDPNQFQDKGNVESNGAEFGTHTQGLFTVKSGDAVGDGTAESGETWAGTGPESLFNAVNDNGYVGDQLPSVYDQDQSGMSVSSDMHGPPDNIRGHWRVQIGADNEINSQHEFSLTNATANGLDLEDDNVLSVDEARTAITAIDHAIDEVNRERSYIGSEQNKLQFTMSNLSNNIQNIEASRSSIEDADFVVEATDLVKNQILAQSGTAMLAQASSISQDILSLIR